MQSLSEVDPAAVRKYGRHVNSGQFEVTRGSDYWKWRRAKVLGCGFCPPNRCENANRRSKYMARGWKDTTRNRRQYQDRNEKKRPPRWRAF